jgi:hypothetical protein
MKKAIILCLFMVLFSAFAVSAQNLIPEKCIFPVSLSCVDYETDYNHISLLLQNGAGRDMLIYNISAASEAFGGDATQPNLNCTCNYFRKTLIKNGEKIKFVLDNSTESCPGWCNQRVTGRTKNKYGPITVSYSWADSPSSPHILTGELLAPKRWTNREKMLSNLNEISSDFKLPAILFLFLSLIAMIYRISTKKWLPSKITIIFALILLGIFVIAWYFGAHTPNY